MRHALQPPKSNLWLKILNEFGLDSFVIRKHISSQLSVRTAGDYSHAWEDIDIDRVMLGQLCEIVKDGMGWPNALFFPDDPFHLLLVDRGMEMLDVETLLCIERKFNSRKEASCKIDALKNGDTFLDICKMLKIAHVCEEAFE